MALRFVSWAAVSSLPQAKKVSIEDQLATNRDHAARHGGQIVAELTVPGESRNIVLFEDACRKIAAYQQLRDLIDAKAFDVLIFLDRSRLGRQAALSMAVVGLCQQARIQIYETENPPAHLNGLDVSHDEQLLGAIKSVGAQREIEKLAMRNKMGMLGRVKAGKPANNLAYGYVYQYDEYGGRRVVVEPTQAGVVRWVFDRYLAGVGFDSIAQELNARGVPSRTGPPWTASAARTFLLMAWRYAGYGELNRRPSPVGRQYLRAKGNWEPIIDEATLERLLAEKRQRAKNRAIPGTQFALTGVCYCEECNGVMAVAGTYKRYGQDYIICRRHQPYPRIPYDTVMAALRSDIAALAGADLATYVGAHQPQADALATQLEAQRAIVTRAKAGLTKADTAYFDGVLDDERYRVQVERMQTQIASAEAEVARLTQALDAERMQAGRLQRLEDVVAHGAAMLAGDATLANAWLRSHVRVRVHQREVFSLEWI